MFNLISVISSYERFYRNERICIYVFLKKFQNVFFKKVKNSADRTAIDLFKDHLDQRFNFSFSK